MKTLQQRDSFVAIWGLGIYTTLAIALFIASVLVQNSIQFVERNSMSVTRQPLFLSVFVIVIWLSFYLGVNSSVSTSREMDKGTLEVLMYGPVDGAAFLLGKYLAFIKIYFLAVIICIIWSNVVTWLLNLVFSVEVTVLFLASTVIASATIAFGILTAVLGGRTRNALIYFILIILLMIGLQVAENAVSGIPLPTSATRNDPILLIRNALVVINSAVQWLSPYAQFNHFMDALLNRSLTSGAICVAVILLQNLVFLGSSILLLNRKGIRG